MRKVINWIYEALFTISHPSFWTMNYPYDKEWDRKVKELFDSGDIEIEDFFYARVGGQKLWYKNYPYASFNKDTDLFEYVVSGKNSVRPSRLTIYRGMKAIKEEARRVLNEEKKL